MEKAWLLTKQQKRGGGEAMPGYISSPRDEVSQELIWQNDKGHRVSPKTHLRFSHAEDLSVS